MWNISAVWVTSEIKSRITMAKAAFTRRKTLFTSKLELKLSKKLVKCCMWNMELYGANLGHFRK